jgi:hypothetical protein
MEKKVEKKLSIFDNMKLSFHILMCKFCSLFEKQLKQIDRDSRHIHVAEGLSPEAKERIKGLIIKQQS